MLGKLLLHPYFYDKLQPFFLDLLVKTFGEEYNKLIEYHQYPDESYIIDYLTETVHATVMKWKTLELEDLKKRYAFLQEFGSWFAPVNVMVYFKLVIKLRSIHNENEWFQYLTKKIEPMFVINVIQVNLRTNLFNRKLWKKLIFYLEKNQYRNDKRYLNQQMQFLVKPISDKVKELAKHIPEINAAFNNEEKWFNLVIKTNVPSFVFLMIDKKLEKNIFNQKLWKRVIHYFTAIKDPKILLGIYSVYCRIFPTDYFMFETYKKLAKKHAKIYVSWLKPFDFEIAREKTPKKAVPVSFLSMIKYIPSKQIRHFRETKEIVGRVAFPGPIIYYIRKYANSYILEKLFQTCKYFFFLQPTPFCHRFIFSDSFKEMKFNYISIGTSTTAKIVSKKLFIQNALHVSQQSDKLALSKFLPNFYKLEIKFLRIHNQKLTKNEFKFIVKEGRIEIMELSDVFVYENDATAKNETLANKLVPLEDIIKLCPKIKEFFSSPTAVSPKTAEFLQNFDFQNDIKVFYIHNLNNFFNIDSFVKFLYVNAKTNSIKYSFSFSPSLNVEQVTAFGEELKQKIACISKFVAQLPVGNI